MHEARSNFSARVPVQLLRYLRGRDIPVRRADRWKRRLALAGNFLILCALPLAGCRTLFKNTPAKAGDTVAAVGAKPSTKLTATARTGPAGSAAALPGAATVPPVRRATREMRVGEVRVIGAGRRFVLIEVSPRPDLPFLSPGLELRSRASGGTVYSGGEETATLRVTSERRQPFIVADVLGGEPHVDDPVYLSSENIHGTIPPFLLRPAPEQQMPPQQPAVSVPMPTSTPAYRATATVHPMGE